MRDMGVGLGRVGRVVERRGRGVVVMGTVTCAGGAQALSDSTAQHPPVWQAGGGTAERTALRWKLTSFPAQVTSPAVFFDQDFKTLHLTSVYLYASNTSIHLSHLPSITHHISHTHPSHTYTPITYLHRC
jgi:hypothetical protein